ncbi:MAG: bifunctional [glutamate--ammonia ligase]-adenylyl-L-tyrosine phosphorylase/[glutamate--ammonia-ligase] adenylyltransferase [Magnetococcales bacterium]|nr:bifunctional [glutamate--ammonia ligase]-adenylyl-L-tyrosine phosphorylase/[glutamate--ammonia-ligase] adenylyltransferase [Magnetococcales bacterium]
MIFSATAQRTLAALAGATAEPQAAADRLTDWLTAHQDRPDRLALLERALADPLWSRRLTLAWGNSPFLANILLRWPEFLGEWLADPAIPAAADLTARITGAVLAEPSLDGAERVLREWKHRLFLRIGLFDLSGEMALMEVTGALSAVADACLEAGLRWLDRDLSAQVGRPLVTGRQGTEAPRPARFTILGMGKLGAGELNFSSDVDLIYLYDEDEGRTDGPRPIPIKTYYTRLGRALIALLSKSTGDGRVFRIDLRLRPEGENGDLCLSTRSAEIYYESWGRTWERAAMIKARPVAGDLALGWRFLETLRPFVFRRYLDFESLEAIREMKHKIDRKIRLAADYHTNLKLGRGGIREIEFLVQTHQLIRGGKEPRLRGRGTLETLEVLKSLGLLDGRTADSLAQSYLFLRTVEHRLQIEREQQTHSLPEDGAAFAALARRLGLSDPRQLRERLAQVTEGVHAAYRGLFMEGTQAREERMEPAIEALLALDPDSDRCLEALRQAGFTDPQAAVPLLRRFQIGPPRTPKPELALRWYQRLAPLLLAEIRQAPDQGMALEHTEQFLVWIGRRINYLALMAEHPRVLTLLIPLFGSSPFLSRFLNHHPELMDSLISRDFLEKAPSRDDLTRRLARQMADAQDEQDRIRVLHDFKNTEVLGIGLRDLAGLAELPEVMNDLSTLADVVLTQVMRDSLKEMTDRFGQPGWAGPAGRQPAEFAIVALGKLGGRELNYASDLDLIFVYDSSGDQQQTDGARSIGNGPFFTRLGQRIINTVTAITQSGRLYELDMRLRPSGNSGPLVTSLESFRTYQHRDAWTWEHQALTRARVVAGSPGLSQALKKAIRTVISLTRDPAAVAAEVVEMRLRMQRDKGPRPGSSPDIKLCRGGIVDIEFLVQHFILAHAARHPCILQRNTQTALLALGDVGLMDRADVERLATSYGFLRLVENRLRLLHDSSDNRISPEELARNRLARLCRLAEGESIVAVLEEHFQGVRAVWDRYLGETERRLAG